MVYGQTELTRDLMDARRAAGLPTVYEAGERRACTTSTARGRASRYAEGRRARTRSRATSSPAATASTASAAPACRAGAITEYEKVYPFGWLGLLSDTPPVSHELIYVNSRARLRALLDAQPHAQPLLPAGAARRQGRATGPTTPSGTSCACASTTSGRDALVTGPSLEKSIAPLRSFVAEPMRFGRLFLAGDAAHIVPPTGAKGLNLAATDVKYLSARARSSTTASGSDAGLDAYSERCLRRVWRAERFSWWFTSLMHQLPRRRRDRRRSCRTPSSTTCSTRSTPRARVAENYVGLPLDFGEGGRLVIIDVHGHYTTAPKALEAWRNQQIAGIKDPSAEPQASRS